VRDRPLGFDPFWQAGVGARLWLERTENRSNPHRGVRMHASVTAYPGLVGSQDAAGNAAAELKAYLPLIGDGPYLALRAGGIGAFGDFAAFDAALIGGWSTLRGFKFERFAGDAAAYGGAELRLPITRTVILLRGELGMFGLADLGRVWVDGESADGWHAGVGGGLWFETLGRAVSIAFASGESDRVYVKLGLPY
jgi:hemolysin activation/secretion protein